MAARDPGDEKRSRLTVPSERGTTRGLTALNRLAVRGSFIFNQKIIAESKIKLSLEYRPVLLGVAFQWLKIKRTLYYRQAAKLVTNAERSLGQVS